MATESKHNCKGTGITRVTLHSYCYGRTERARKVHYPERCAQEDLGRQSDAVYRAYAKSAVVTIPALEECEELFAGKIIDIDRIGEVVGHRRRHREQIIAAWRATENPVQFRRAFLGRRPIIPA
jgi:hypothetical protein